MSPPLSDKVREEISDYFIKCKDTSFIHAATTVTIDNSYAARLREGSHKSPPKLNELQDFSNFLPYTCEENNKKKYIA